MKGKIEFYQLSYYLNDLNNLLYVNSLAGLSHAMDQLYSRRGSITDDKEQLINRSILNVTMSPEQIKKLDKITQEMQHDKFWEVKKNIYILIANANVYLYF